MRFGPRFLAVDWGTTNRRAFLLDGGTVVDREQSPRGVTAVAADGFPDEVAALRTRFGNVPVLMAGMVGSTIGWRTAPYVPAPAGAAQIAAQLLSIDERTAIVPGVSDRTGGRADVMRGEEVQLLGAVAAGLVPPDATLCHPGTHCKWATLEGGRIMRFTTAMTGELFALLRNHSVLAAQLRTAVAPDAAFRAGVAEGARRDLVASLFGVRAAAVLGLRDDAESAAFASGLMIGSDVAARLAEVTDDTIHVLADPLLAALYAAAIEVHGRRAVILSGDDAFVAGTVAIERHIR